MTEQFGCIVPPTEFLRKLLSVPFNIVSGLAQCQRRMNEWTTGGRVKAEIKFLFFVYMLNSKPLLWTAPVYFKQFGGWSWTCSYGLESFQTIMKVLEFSCVRWGRTGEGWRLQVACQHPLHRNHKSQGLQVDYSRTGRPQNISWTGLFFSSHGDHKTIPHSSAWLALLLRRFLPSIYRRERATRVAGRSINDSFGYIVSPRCKPTREHRPVDGARGRRSCEYFLHPSLHPTPPPPS